MAGCAVGHSDDHAFTGALVRETSIVDRALPGRFLLVVDPVARDRVWLPGGQLPFCLADIGWTVWPWHQGPVATWIGLCLVHDAALLNPLPAAFTSSHSNHF